MYYAYYSQQQQRAFGAVAVYSAAGGGEVECTEVSARPPDDPRHARQEYRGRALEFLRIRVTDPEVHRIMRPAGPGATPAAMLDRCRRMATAFDLEVAGVPFDVALKTAFGTPEGGN